MGTYSNSIDQMMQFICLYKVVKKYTGCNLKTTALLDCALTGVSAVMRSNTVTNMDPLSVWRPLLKKRICSFLKQIL